MFQHREWPEGFEFPACNSCNQGTEDADLLIALLGRLNPIEAKGDSDGKFQGLLKMVNKQHRGLLQKMLPSAVEARRNNRALGMHPQRGQTHQETGIVKVPDELHAAVCSLAKKLSKGLFYREAGQVFPDEGCLLLHWFTNADFLRDGKYIAFDVLKDLEGSAPPTERSGKYLGDQFQYKISLSSEKTIFVLQARFGKAFGLVVFGSSTLGLLEAAVDRLREQTSRDGPFAVLQSPSIR